MRHVRRWLYCCLLPAALSAAGCASFWDEVTSRDFKFKDLFTPAHGGQHNAMHPTRSRQ